MQWSFAARLCLIVRAREISRHYYDAYIHNRHDAVAAHTFARTITRTLVTMQRGQPSRVWRVPCKVHICLRYDTTANVNGVIRSVHPLFSRLR